MGKRTLTISFGEETFVTRTSKVPWASFRFSIVIVPVGCIALTELEVVLTRAFGTLVDLFAFLTIVLEELLVREFEVLLVVPAVKLESTVELVVAEVASSSSLDEVALLLFKVVGFSVVLAISFIDLFELLTIVLEELLIREFEALLVVPAVKLESTVELVAAEAASSSSLDEVALLLFKVVGFSVALVTSLFHSKL